MKGIIVRCMADLVTEKFGAPAWDAVLAEAGQAGKGSELTFPVATIDDAVVLALIAAACKTSGLTRAQIADAFGEYWVCTFAPKHYARILSRFKNARELLMGMDAVHVEMTRVVENAQPPRFQYEWPDTKKLIMTYQSNRGLIDFLAGLVKGVGKYYKEKLTVTKLSGTKLQILFP